MNKNRVFPTLTIINDDMVKTKKFNKPIYLGDPINAVKLFNNKNIDEISILDISSRYTKNEKFNLKLLSEIAREAFLPLSYGGNITEVDDALTIVNLGFEKIIINSMFHNNPHYVRLIVDKLGSQSVVLKLDYTFSNNSFKIFSQGKIHKEISLNILVENIISSGVGELILSRIDYDGMMCDFDTDFAINFRRLLNIPLVLCHGAKDLDSFEKAQNLNLTNFTASSIFVFFGNLKGILINNPFENKDHL
jgi:imidazole glycerol-phosphate synthase subunit HisF